MTNGNPFCGLDAFGLLLHFNGFGREIGFSGSAWRGLMGQALFRSVCLYPSPVCATCPSAGICAYTQLFKPLDEAALPPFWLHGWRRNSNGWTVGIRWLGRGNCYAVGEWLVALSHENAGLSFGGSPVRLIRADAETSGKTAWISDTGWRASPDSIALATEKPVPASCRVRFITPLVSKHVGDPLFGALHTRTQRLVQQYGDGSVVPRPSSPWTAREIRTEQRRIPILRRVLKGKLCEMELSDIAPEAWVLLNAGVELHAGGQAGMGCGHYEILAA